jgi:hypothetical protein
MKHYGLALTVLLMGWNVITETRAIAAESSSSGVSKVHYICNGIRPLNSHYKLQEGVACFNPTPREATTTWTFYTSNAAPTVLTFKIKPNSRTWGKGFPKDPWGLKIESSEPISVQGFNEYIHQPYSHDLSETPENERTLCVYSCPSATALATVFFLPDCSTSPSPENRITTEKQWFTVCNPNTAAAKLTITANYNDKGVDTREITVPAQRFAHFEMSETGLKKYEGCAMSIASDMPVAILQTRTCEGTPKGKFNQMMFSIFTFMIPGDSSTFMMK